MIRVRFAKPKVRVFLNSAKWEEEKHPRAKDGKFGESEGESENIDSEEDSKDIELEPDISEEIPDLSQRVKYELSENDKKKIAQRKASFKMPSDEELKAQWAKSHHGKTRGWGLLKKDRVLESLKGSESYMLGLGQGRVDKARKTEYATKKETDPLEPGANAFNLGYYRGYIDYESNRRGWDEPTRKAFDTKYIAANSIKVYHARSER